MDIDPQIAETIVSNIKGVLNHEINLFDTSGTIIASTDRSRIGTGHDGARLAVEVKHTISIDNEHQFEGARNGINVPVLLNDSVVAVIGITGRREEVEPFGNIIKKMTEILIRENMEKVTQFDHRMMMSNLVNVLSGRRQDPGLAAYLASVLGVELDRPRRAVVGGPQEGDLGEGQDRVFVLLSQKLEDRPDCLLSVSHQQVSLLVDLPEDGPDTTEDLAKDLQETLADRLGLQLAFGMGGREPRHEDYWKSYSQAERTLDWLLFTRRTSITDFADLDLGRLVSALSPEEAQGFVDRVFGNLNDRRIDDFQTIFAAYTRHNGSIIHAADDLYLHKNTMQNRLNTIASETGYNPRVLKDYAVLSAAFTLRKYLRFKRRRGLPGYRTDPPNDSSRARA
ncbi:transcriptional regulator, CdaR [Bifidobacterium actinocoloniiforme DSM 22766]|uniref:Transcriptional regulator, CdaR n=1 Tax=Bifidobacterium actinocoloniiforme DSM 22766 TaxID=1437605 RepID=A0A086YZF4_9BIFI|nr:sugar diacid recognition domain-containing protein [Bifidobacterium actinocoloniiforme]KFI39654.1 transcriptional regulator, CdaR [Bifidobacterium actinocoloniiforme DSM 22766]